MLSEEARQEFLNSVEEARTPKPAAQDAIPDRGRYAAGLEAAANQAMLREQQEKGSENAVRMGLQNVADRDKLTKQAGRSTLAALQYAAEDLSKQSAALANRDPERSELLAEQANRISELANSVQTTTHDTQLGVNLRYGTPFGSGRNAQSTSELGGDPAFMPRYSGISRDSAMNIPLASSYGTKNLGDRIETIQEYARRDNPFVKAAGGSFAMPGFAQYHNMQMEGLNPSDLSAGGWMKAAGSAGLQGVSPFIMAAGGPVSVGAGAGIGAVGTKFSRSDRPESYDEDKAMWDAAGELGWETLGGAVANTGLGAMFPSLSAKAGKAFRGARRAVGGRATGNGNRRLQNTLDTEIRNYDRMISEATPIAQGEPQAVENAFVKYARQNNDFAGDAAEAWRYAPGYVADEFGARTGKAQPWVDYAKGIRKEEQGRLENLRKEVAKLKGDRASVADRLAMEESRFIDDMPVRNAEQRVSDIMDADAKTASEAVSKQIGDEKRKMARLTKAKQNKENSVYTNSEQQKISSLNADMRTYEFEMKNAERIQAQNPNDKDAAAAWDKAFRNYDKAESRLLSVKAKASDRMDAAVQRAQKTLEDSRSALETATRKAQEASGSKGAMSAQRSLEMARNNYQTALAQKQATVNELKRSLAEIDERILASENALGAEPGRVGELLGESAQDSYKRNATRKLQNDTQKKIDGWKAERLRIEERLADLGESATAEAPRGGFSFSPFIGSAVSLGGAASATDKLFYPGFSDSNPVQRPEGSAAQEAWNKLAGSYFGTSTDDDVARFRGYRRK